MDWLTGTRPLIIGHRGASADAPENSLAAFLLAVEQGADGIEFDVQLSRDGVPMIMHDDTVDRTCDGRGRVADMTCAELQQLHLGEGEVVPTLANLFELLGTRTLYNVELKDMGLAETGLEEKATEVIKSCGVGGNVLISSFNPLTLRRVRRYLPPEIPLGFLRERKLTRLACRLARAAADHPLHSLVDQAQMEWARDNGYRVNVWTVDDPDEARRLVDLGVNGIITNKPGALRQQLGERHV